MAARVVQLCVALLVVAVSARAQRVEYCPVFGTNSISWNPNTTPNLQVITRAQGTSSYHPNVQCYFSIQTTVPGRIIVQVLDTNLFAFSASISIRTDLIGGYLSSWDAITYSRDKNGNFISITNKLYISFSSRSSPLGISPGVHLSLTFLPAYGCPPGWIPMLLDGYSQCVGQPTNTAFDFGPAQRYCNLQRSNLLVSERDNVASVLQRVRAANVWIGMTAEPSGSYTSYRWINNIRVSANQPVSCTSPCRPGSTNHRCVYASQNRTLVQADCRTLRQPLCYMPAGGTDTFYAGSSALRASGALLTGAVLLILSLMR